MEHRSAARLIGMSCLTVCFNAGQAQLVFITDTNFRELLSWSIPGAIDANGFLDTQHPEALGLETLGFEWPQSPSTPTLPLDLTGIMGLFNLQKLTIHCCHTDGGMLGVFDDVPVTVPAWPASLRALDLWFGTYTTMPPWPDALEELELDLPSGPSVFPPLPATLERIKLKAGEDLSTLPDLPAGIHHVTLEAPVDNTVPPLPSSIDTLSINGFGPAGVSAWPDSLLSVSLNHIDQWTALPTWPSGVAVITITHADGLSALPDWPGTLMQLNLSSCSGLTSLPDFNNGLVDITLSSLAALSALPDYPATVEELLIGNLGVTTLPDWPPLVERIRIGQTMPNLIALPDFPNEVRYITTYGDFPALTALPAWPDSLRELTVYSASINEFPPFPAHMTALLIADLPNLHCLPLLPESLGWFFNLVPGLCLPNIPAGLTSMEVGPDQFIPITTSMLCNVLNSTCDFLNPVATGSVYWDENANGTRDAGEPGYPYSAINAQPGNITYGVPSTGEYALPLPFDQYTLTASSNNPYVMSISPASHDAPFATTTDVDAGNDFGVVLQPDMQDLNIDLMGPRGRPGFETPGGITCGNIGSTEQPCTVTLQLDANLSWVSAEPAPTSVNGNTITWDLPDLGIGQTRHISFTVYTDVSVPLGTQLVHTATIGDVPGDETPSDNTATSYAGVDGSWDPNDKRVEPTSLTPTEVAAGEEVIYTIRFQNTGTYQADRVIIIDELSADLQWNTMRLINSSHPCTWVLSDEGRLRFTFDPIFLPDSISDEPNSHGYVRFAMKPVADLMLGETVGNTASIYFDFNEPVITNEAIFSVETSTSISSNGVVTPSVADVWPNPAEHCLFLAGAEGRTIEVLDVTGRMVLRERARGSVHVLDVRALAPGRYSARIVDGSVRPFIKR